MPPIRASLLALALAAPVAAAPLPASGPAPRTRAETVAGVWEGFTFDGAYLVGLRLTLEPDAEPPPVPFGLGDPAPFPAGSTGADAAEAFAGELEFLPLVDEPGPGGRPRPGVRGKHAARAELHPTTLAFRASPGPWHAAGRVGGSYYLSGVLDPGEPALFGWASSQRRVEPQTRFPFVLWRPDAAAPERARLAAATATPNPQDVLPDPTAMQAIQQEVMGEMQRVQQQLAQTQDPARRQELQEKLREIQLSLPARMQRALAPDLDVTQESLTAWLEAPAREHAEWMPDGALRLESNYQGQGLVADEYFVPVFGKPLEELTGREKYALGRLLQDRRQTLATREEGVTVSVVIELLGSPLVVGREQVQRRRRAWRGELLRRLAALPPSADVFVDVAVFEELARQHLAGLWSSEREEVAAALDAARHRLADDALMARARRDAKSVEDAAAALRLSSWRDRQRDLAPYTTAEGWARAEAVVHERLDALLERELAPRRAALADLGQGVDAVRAGVGWYQGLVAAFGLAQDRPPMRAAVGQLAARRGADLAAALDALTAELAGLASQEQAAAFLTAHLSVPGDAETPAGAALHDALRRRRIEIDRELFLARFSDREEALMGDDGALTVPARVDEPPTAEEVRLAYLREVEWLGGEMLDHETAKMSMPGLNLLGVYNYVKVESVAVLRSKSDGGPTGFVVEYDMDIHMRVGEMFEELLAGPDFGAQLLRDMLRMVNTAGPTRVVDRFVLTPTGWRSPTIRDRGLEGIASFYGSVADGLNTAAEAFGF